MEQRDGIAISSDPRCGCAEHTHDQSDRLVVAIDTNSGALEVWDRDDPCGFVPANPEHWGYIMAALQTALAAENGEQYGRR